MDDDDLRNFPKASETATILDMFSCQISSGKKVKTKYVFIYSHMFVEADFVNLNIE